MTNVIAYALAGISSMLEIVGVIGIFFARDKGLKQIMFTEYVQVYKADENDPVDVGLNISKRNIPVEEIMQNLQKNITATNDVNRLIMQKSKLWLGLIILGFALQLLATVHFYIQALKT